MRPRLPGKQAIRSVTASLLAGTLGIGTALAQDGAWRTDFSRHSVPLSEIVAGGPPKDGIPALDRPRFVSVREAARWLDAREPVIAVELGGEAKAYPLQILIWHEIVNDEVGGIPVTVTYCPLCNTALAFDRRNQNRVLDFGTTGRLRHSDLVMYDRQTESWWQQATGEAIVGSLTGVKLQFIPAPLLSWREFSRAYPNGQVLSRETGFDRPYGRNPYTRYDDTRGSPIARFFQRDPDSRLPPMARVATIESGRETIAVPFSRLAKERVVNEVVGDLPVVVFWSPGTASAVDAGRIAEGKDVGSSAAFDRRVAGKTLTFEAAGDGQFRDRETSSRWTLLGHAVAGPLAGSRLTPIPHGTPFWFAWAAFRPETRVAR